MASRPIDLRQTNRWGWRIVDDQLEIWAKDVTTGEWYQAGGSGSSGSGVVAASVVLYCPTLVARDGETPPMLTPTDGDLMYWVDYTPGLSTPDPMTGLNDWTGRESFNWTEGWATANDPTNVLMLPGTATWFPTILAEVTPTGFTEIPVYGGQPIILGCGSAEDFSSSVWSGWNFGGTNIGGAIDPTVIAYFIVPSGTVADTIKIIDKTGGNDHKNLAEWIQENGTKYYYSNLTTQPWLQENADFGTEANGIVYGHVTRTNNYWAQANINFEATVNVVTPGGGPVLFYVREIFQSLDPSFNGWYWGWSNPNIRTSVHGQLGGLPFVGFVNRDGSVLDLDGNSITRVVQTGDYLIGTVTGVFQND